MQFSGLPVIVKNRLISRLSGTSGRSGGALRSKNKGGFFPGKIDLVFFENTWDPHPSAPYEGNTGIRIVRYGGFEGVFPRWHVGSPDGDAST